MKSAIASILILWVVIALSPQGMEAFGQITDTKIIIGQMDLTEGLNAEINAVGRKGRVLWGISCTWQSGQPVDFNYEYFEMGI